MANAVSSRGLPRLHDSADEETAAKRWDRALFEQIARDLARPPPRIYSASAPVRIHAPPNPFETRTAGDPPPPWTFAPAASPRRRAPARARRSKMPLVVLAMMLGIGVGLWRDPVARTGVTRELRATTADVADALTHTAVARLL